MAEKKNKDRTEPTRRELRKRLGSRTIRRQNTKTKVLRDHHAGPGDKAPEYTYAHAPQRTRPKVRLAALMKGVKIA